MGPRGNVLESLQELTRLAVQQETGVRSRLMLDIAAVARRPPRRVGRPRPHHGGEGAVARVRRVRLHPMTPFERKVVHDAVAAVAGVHSESEGEEPQRRVVVFPKA